MAQWRIFGIKRRYWLVLVTVLCIQSWLFSMVYQGKPLVRPINDYQGRDNGDYGARSTIQEHMKRTLLEDPGTIPTASHDRSIPEFHPQTDPETNLDDDPDKRVVMTEARGHTLKDQYSSVTQPSRKKGSKSFIKTETGENPLKSKEAAAKHGRSMKSTKYETPIQGDLLHTITQKENNDSRQDNVLKEKSMRNISNTHPTQNKHIVELPLDNSSVRKYDVTQNRTSKQDGASKQDGGIQHKHANSPSLPAGIAASCPQILMPDSKPKETFNWYKIREREIYAFSAYFDGRESARGPLVRVLGMGLQQKFNNIGPLYCVLAFQGLDHPISIRATYEVIYPSENWPNEYTAHWILCPVPREVLKQRGEPVSASVLPSACEPLPHFRLPVHVRERRPPGARKRIALCLPALYGGQDWQQTAEWIILHKLLGYSTVFFYVQSSGVQTNAVLSLYSNHYDPDITIKSMPWTLPRLWYFYKGQHAAINDCVYRAGLNHDYVTVADKDELVIPMAQTSILDFLSKFENETTAAFMFQHVMVDMGKTEPLTFSQIKNITGIDTHDINLNDLQLVSLTHKSHMKKPYPAETVRSKTIYNVERTISVDIHTPRHLVSGFKEVLVAPSDGAVYHYRINPPEKWLKDVPYEYGKGVERYRTELLTEMIRVLEKLSDKN